MKLPRPVIELGTIGIVVLLIVVGFNALGRHIYNRTDCERFNIDNIELRIGIDIPSIIDCECSSDGDVKESKFTIDTSEVDINRYIKRNKFDKKDSLYINQGETSYTKWIATFNDESASLNIRIEYKEKTG